MRFNDAPGPIGRHGARGKCGRGQRPLPAALRFMARATSLCAKAFAASRLVASAALPLFTTTHLIGASITSTVNLAFEFSVVKTFYVGQEKIIAVACYRSNAFPSGLDARSSFRVSTT